MGPGAGESGCREEIHPLRGGGFVRQIRTRLQVGRHTGLDRPLVFAAAGAPNVAGPRPVPLGIVGVVTHIDFDTIPVVGTPALEALRPMCAHACIIVHVLPTCSAELLQMLQDMTCAHHHQRFLTEKEVKDQASDGRGK